MKELALQLVEAARRSVALGLNHGTAGNLSVRTGEAFLITPTGAPLDQVAVDDLVRVDLAAESAPARASSEWRLHRDIYRARPDAGAVVHTHSRFATTLACLRLDLPAVHYMVAVAGTGVVRCAEYATFGTAELSRAAVAALGTAHACLLANHGVVAIGAGSDMALRVAGEVERVAEWYWRARAIGSPKPLSEQEMAEVFDRFRDYGTS